MHLPARSCVVTLVSGQRNAVGSRRSWSASADYSRARFRRSTLPILQSLSGSRPAQSGTQSARALIGIIGSPFLRAGRPPEAEPSGREAEKDPKGYHRVVSMPRLGGQARRTASSLRSGRLSSCLNIFSVTMARGRGVPAGPLPHTGSAFATTRGHRTFPPSRILHPERHPDSKLSASFARMESWPGTNCFSGFWRSFIESGSCVSQVSARLQSIRWHCEQRPLLRQSPEHRWHGLNEVEVWHAPWRERRS